MLLQTPLKVEESWNLEVWRKFARLYFRTYEYWLIRALGRLISLINSLSLVILQKFQFNPPPKFDNAAILWYESSFDDNLVGIYEIDLEMG